MDDVVEALDTILAVVNRTFSIGQKLEVDLVGIGVACRGELSYISEAPDTSDLVASL